MNNEKEYYYKPPKNLMISPSGMRGQIGESLTLEVSLRFTKSYGLWLGQNSNVLIGMDTRNTSLMLSNIVSAGLMDVGINVTDAGICPTPAIVFYKRKFGYDGSVIISGSHNPPSDNGLKFLSRTNTFLGIDELAEIYKYFYYTRELRSSKWKDIGKYKQTDIISTYINNLKKYLQLDIFKQNKKLRVVIDTGAGAGINVIDKILRDLGCEVILINDKFTNYPEFPREIEPIQKNLTELSRVIRENNADVGFAFDCDADRVAIANSDGFIYPEDVTVILLVKYILEKQFETKNKQNKFENAILVTNSASSMNFEQIALEYNIKVIRTPVGERYLAIKMDELIKEFPRYLIFGGEGSSGGFMYPPFNNARDGIFASCLISQLLLDKQQSLKDLIEKLPKLYTTRKILDLKQLPVNLSIQQIIQTIKTNLDLEKINYESYINDIRIVNLEKLEWILIHPSNTEPIIRVITEAKTFEKASELCEYGIKLLKKAINL